MSRGQRFFVLHGHFYQPPRENPWLDDYEPEHSAAPYRDWNQRIARECYGPNAYARVVDDNNRVLEVINNYESLSFDFGPTLMRWLEKFDPPTYGKVLAGDRFSLEKTGFGNALAHPFNHVIMPLAGEEEKTVQVRWGMEDFRRRFGREPLGMWLPETAADVATLAALAREGIKFTVLAPRQAKRIRPLGRGTWCQVDESTLDTSGPYLQRLPGGLSIAIFFFHGPLSREISFEEGLKSAPALMKKMAAELEDDGREGTGLITLATDGETFGHHYKFGEMGAAALFREAAAAGLFTPTNFAHFLSLHPPAFEVEIEEDTSWSCAHGVERWRADCGCRLGETKEHQRWRGPLREGLERLSEKIDGLYTKTVEPLVQDPRAARDAYVDVVLRDTAEAREDFLERVSRKELSEEERRRLLSAMEMLRSRLAMFTSCGWFFNEISGLETVIILRFAARACDLARKLGESPEQGLLDDLARAPSNRREYDSGRGVYLKEVAPSRPDPALMAAGRAAAELLGLHFSHGSLRIEQETAGFESPGTHTLGGLVELHQDRTGEKSRHLVLAVAHRGRDLELLVNDAGDETLADELSELVRKGETDRARSSLASLEGTRSINLHALPPALREGLLEAASGSARDRLAGLLTGPGSGLGPILELAGPESRVPSWLHTLLGLVLDFRLAEAVEGLGRGDAPRDRPAIADSLARFGHEPDYDLLSLAFNRALGRLAQGEKEPSPRGLDELLDMAGKLDPDLDFWELQNRFYDARLAPGSGNPEPGQRELLHRLGEFLGFSRKILERL